ncbi:MAG TPA: methylmalonyl Co-A mutase-associated GTPase MeaB [Bacteroidia bacterium]|nr:methylmalonyl Co-A mutase-associated GTPase MeaB [Bacteroidia bacterium]
MNQTDTLLLDLQNGDMRALARCITIVENDIAGYEDLLLKLKHRKTVPVIGITGPPGAGKSTLINGLIEHLTNQNFRVGVIAIDPTSPFNHGSLLGDRVRMSAHFLNPKVFIRSLATRGSLGGLSAKTIEITDVMKASGVDFVLVETVGVGQSEIEIVGLADTTVLVLVPEAGDEVQSLKSGIMEIADIYVVNKADRPGASIFLKNLQLLVHEHAANSWIPRIVKAVATQNEGIEQLVASIQEHQLSKKNINKALLLAERAFQLIQNYRMKDVNKATLAGILEQELNNPDFNLYRFIKNYY